MVGEPQREVPVAHLVGGRHGHRPGVDTEDRPLEPGAPGLGEGALERRERGRVVALAVVHRREDVHRAQQGEVGGAGPRGDGHLEPADRLARVARALAEPGEDRGEVGAVDGEVVLDGQGHRLVGDAERLGRAAAVHERLGPAGEQVDPQLHGRVVGEQAEGLLGEGEPVDLLLGDPGREGEGAEQLGALVVGRARRWRGRPAAAPWRASCGRCRWRRMPRAG